LHNRVGSAQLVARRISCTRSYGQRAQSGRECTIFKCVTTTRLCHLQGILPNLVLLAYIDTLVVQAKLTHNKSVVHVKTTRDRRLLAITNQKGWSAELSLNFIGWMFVGFALKSLCLTLKVWAGFWVTRNSALVGVYWRQGII